MSIWIDLLFMHGHFATPRVLEHLLVPPAAAVPVGLAPLLEPSLAHPASPALAASTAIAAIAATLICLIRALLTLTPKIKSPIIPNDRARAPPTRPRRPRRPRRAGCPPRWVPAALGARRARWHTGYVLTYPVAHRPAREDPCDAVSVSGETWGGAA